MNAQKDFYAIHILIKNWIFRIALFAVIIGAIINFSVNPEGLTILIVLCLIVAAFLKDEQIRINEKNWEFIKLYAFGLLKTKEIFNYYEIDSISLAGDSTNGSFIDTVADRHFQNLGNEINISLKNGNSQIIKTKLYKSTLQTIIPLIKEQIHNQV